jgi:hypothetical protein
MITLIASTESEPVSGGIAEAGWHREGHRRHDWRYAARAFSLGIAAVK